MLRRSDTEKGDDMRAMKRIDLDSTCALDYLEDIQRGAIVVETDDREQGALVLSANWYALLAVQKVETLRGMVRPVTTLTIGYLSGRLGVLAINANSLERKCALIISAMSADASRLHFQSSIRPAYKGY
jgi:hypothetical protein